MERKIGEIFKHNGEWYQCVGGTCRNCSFYYDTVCKNITTIGSTNFGNCHCSLRTDHKSVIFKKLEKVGEPYERYLASNNSIKVQRYRLPYRCAILPKEPIILIEPNFKNSIEIEIKQTKEDMEEKKLNLKPFDIQKAREGNPVCTRDGRKARIICFDRKHIYEGQDYSIVALINEGSYSETVCSYTKDGLHTPSKIDNNDLMMLPEKKEGWVNVYKNQIHDTPESAEEGHKGITDYIKTIRVEWED